MVDLPKQDLLLKLLRMTESDSDGEALTAIRKANSLLTSAGWTWEKLLKGKITIVEDPFSKIATPDPGYRRAPPPPTSPRPPQTATTARPSARDFSPDQDWSQDWASPPPPPPYKPQGRPQRGPDPIPPSAPASSSFKANWGYKPNINPSYCYCCGDPVPCDAGFMFEAYRHLGKASGRWETICGPCNRGKVRIRPSAAKRNYPSPLNGPSPNLRNL